MKIDNRFNYQKYPNYSNNRDSRVAKQQATPQFTGAASTAVKLSDRVLQEIPGAKIFEKMKSLKWLEGEAGGITITALGTGLVAPIFIGFNPFVKAPKDSTPEQKKDVKNTKLYTAMRQPISAVLAVVFQLSALKPIDKFLDTLINNPEYSKKWSVYADHSAINTKSYIKSTVKGEFEKAGKKKPSYLKVFTEGWKKVTEGRNEYDQSFDLRVQEIEDAQIKSVAEKFQQTGKIHISGRTLDNPSLAELVNKEINNYIKDAEKLKINKKGLAYYSEKARILISNEEYLKNIFKDIPIDAIRHTKDETKLKQLYKQTEEIVRNQLAKETNPDIQTILKEILDRSEDIRSSRISRTLSRIDNIKEMCGGKYSYDKYLKAMTGRNGELDNIITKLTLAKIKDPSKANDKSITDTINKIVKHCSFKNDDKLLKSILHDTDTFDFDTTRLLKKVHKDITKGFKKLSDNRFKPFSQVTKIFIGVAITLPITCNALNWVYPRFMELCFPKLAGIKKQDNVEKGGNK